MMPVDLTIAICTYNGEKRIPAVLNGLKNQQVSTTITWEVIVVDNNSRDRTAEVVKAFQAEWPDHVSLRYCFESKQGLGFARQRAVEMATGVWVGFLDDDNVPAANWVNAVHEFGTAHPKAGVYGSYIRPQYEIPPPEHFHRISRFLAIGGADKAICYSSPEYQAYRKFVYPPGAGAVVRRQAWLESVPKTLKMQGRVSGHQLPGDDVEAFSYLRNAGWEIWHNPAMLIEHQIPSGRLKANYIKKMMWSTGLSRHYTRYLAHQRLYWAMVTLYWMNDLRKLLQHCCQYPLFSQDIVTQGERHLLLGSLTSPFHFLFCQFLTGNSPLISHKRNR